MTSSGNEFSESCSFTTRTTGEALQTTNSADVLKIRNAETCKSILNKKVDTVNNISEMCNSLGMILQKLRYL